jgi:hypothetical protein
MTIYDYSILRFFEMILLLHKSPRKRWPHNEVTRIRPRIRPKKTCVQVPVNKLINTELGHCEDVDRSISNQQVHAVPMAQSRGFTRGNAILNGENDVQNRRNWHGPTKNATYMSSERPWLFGGSIPNFNPGLTWGVAQKKWWFAATMVPRPFPNDRQPRGLDFLLYLHYVQGMIATFGDYVPK